MDLSVLSRRGALPALSALARVHPKPLGAMEFLVASGLKDNTSVAKLRADLEILDVIAIEEVLRGRDVASEKRITLTPLGLALGRLAIEMEREIAKHNRGKK